MATIGTLAVKIVADSDSLSRGLNDASREVSKFGDRVESVMPTIAKFGAAAAAAGAAIGLKLFKDITNAADELAKLSQRTGIAVEDLSRLQYAAGLSGVETAGLTQSLNFLARGISQTAQGVGESAQAFAAMGIAVKNADGTLRDQRSVLMEVADRFASYEDGAGKSALAMRIFGEQGARLIPLLNSGSRGLREMAQESDDLGNTMTTETAKAAEQFNDNLTRVQTAVMGAAREISGPLIKALADLSDKFADAARQGKGFWEGIWKSGIQDIQMQKANDAVALLEHELAGLESRLKSTEQTAQRSGGFATLQVEKYLKKIARVTAELDKARAARDALIPAEIQGPPSDAITQQPRTAAPQMGAIVDFEQRERDMQALFLRIADAEIQAEVEKNAELDKILNDRLGAEYAARQEALTNRIMAFQESLLTEEQLERERFAKKIEDLRMAQEMQVITESERMLLVEDLERQHQENLTKITEAEAQKRADAEKRSQDQITTMRNAATMSAVNLLQLLGGKSKAAALAAIALNRGLMIAQTIQNTAAAKMRALAELGPIAGAAAAAKIQALGNIQMGLIAAAGLAEAGGARGGGGGSGGVGSIAAPVAGTVGAAAPAVAVPTQIANINVTGESFSRGQVVSLVQTINELSADGVRLVIQ